MFQVETRRTKQCVFFFPKIRHSATKKNGYEDPKAKISEKSRKFASF
jgi:hypothetical protein